MKQKKPKFRLFSAKDGKRFGEHIEDAADWVKDLFARLPQEVKKIMPEAEDFVAAAQALREALEEGQSLDRAIDIALSFIPGERDEAFYELAKDLITKWALRLQMALDELKEGIEEYAEGGSPALVVGAVLRDGASDLIIAYNGGNVERSTANLGVELALFIMENGEAA